MEMRILFLDFDGVINSEEWYHKRPYAGMKFDPELVMRVQRLCQQAKAEIVVSSSWRLLSQRRPNRTSSLDYVRGCLDGYGFRAEIIGVTPPYSDKGPARGCEIQDWLDDQPAVTSFAILDDTEDMLHLSHRYVKTDWQVGITEDDVEKAISLLHMPIDRRGFDSPRCPDCGGTLGGDHLGRLENHRIGCPSFPL